MMHKLRFCPTPFFGPIIHRCHVTQAQELSGGIAPAVPILFAIAMGAQEIIKYAAALHPEKNIFMYLLLGLDIVLDKLIATAGLIQVFRICRFLRSTQMTHETRNSHGSFLSQVLASPQYKSSTLFALPGTITN